jgi:sugar transferase (PEP-CTERM system associated)
MIPSAPWGHARALWDNVRILRASSSINAHIPRALFLKSSFDTLLLLLSLYGGILGFGLNGERIVATSLESYFLWPLPATALIFSLTIVITMAVMGIYDPDLRAGPASIIARITASCLCGAWLTDRFLTVYPQLSLGGRVFLGEKGFTIGVLCALGTVLACRLLHRNYVNPALARRVLILGTGKKAKIVERLRRATDRRGIKVVGYLHFGRIPALVKESEVVRLDIDTRLPDFVKRKRIDELVLAFDDRRQDIGIAATEILECKASGVSVIDITTFYERQAGKVDLASITPRTMALSDIYTKPLTKCASKRLSDIVLGSTLLLIAWPVMLVIAIAILIESNGRDPIFYQQERVGKNGKPFMLKKFRSMRVDAEQDGVAQWAQVEDHRITRVGAFIRKTRLDELPQLINVIRGEMSLVGPRPERPQMVSQLSEAMPTYSLRSLVKPGITGWAQIRYPYGASAEDAGEKLQFDLYYIKYFSFPLDLMIIMQTPQVIVWRKGGR